MVHVANWSAGKVLYQPAEKAGCLHQYPRLYDDPSNASFALDNVWSEIERSIGVLDAGVGAPHHRAVPVEEFLTAWIPYVAQLIARAPRIGLGLSEDLRVALSGSTAWRDRALLLGHLVDAFTVGSRWSVIECAERAFLSSDAGFAFLPTQTGGALYVPLSPTRALFIERGSSMVTNRKIRIPHAVWSAGDIDVHNDALILSAGREIYARDATQAADALKLWCGERAPPNHRGLTGDPLRAAALDFAQQD